MLATINVQTKGVRNQAILLEALTNLLLAKGFEVSNEDGHLTISADEQAVKDCMAINQRMETAPSKPESALAMAYKIVHGDREQTYGDAGKNFRTIAAYWNTHIKAAKSIDARLTEADVCGMMILLKQARLANSPMHRDSIVDIIGYAELHDMINIQHSDAEAKAVG